MVALAKRGSLAGLTTERGEALPPPPARGSFRLLVKDVEVRAVRVHAGNRRVAFPVVHVPLRGRDPLVDRGRRHTPWLRVVGVETAVVADDENPIAPIVVRDLEHRQA